MPIAVSDLFGALRRRHRRPGLAARWPPSVAQALRTLEELRAGGLVDQAEYDAKRREILSRL